jgi:uncharacterized membrane protein
VIIAWLLLFLPAAPALAITSARKRLTAPVADLTLGRFPITIYAMAKTVAVVISDDLDGSDGAETVTFGLDGVTYEIDLAEKNRVKFEKALAPYVEHGRRVRQQHRASRGASASPRVDRAAIRAWAKANGLKVSERGRISADVIAQYEASH